MRLSTSPDRDEARSIAVLHAALDAGVNFLDTADAYCHDSSETGHNERLIAAALATWTGDRSRILVATKGGLTRPQGGWVTDGRARHLFAACDASRRALGIGRIPLYQLHAPDPRTPFATSVRALDSLKRDGLAEAIGLCNVTVGQIEEARGIADISTVQVELNPWRDDSFLTGVPEYCVAHGIRLLAHRPLGGPQRQRRTLADPVLREIARRHGASPFEIAIAWLEDLSPLVVALPGSTRPETARSIARARRIRLTDDDRSELDEHFRAGRVLRRMHAGSAPPATKPAPDGEIVLIMGLPAAGKSTAARTWVERGYTRLNRDEYGGTLRSLLPPLDQLIDSGNRRIVLDNTYVSRKSRASVVEAASGRGLAVRCVWLSTTLEDAQVNAATRMVRKYGRLLGPEEIRQISRKDANVFGPAVQFRYQRELEPPHPSEGFAEIETVPFERARDPSSVNRALICWCDGVLRRSRSGARTPSSREDVEVLPGRAEVLRRCQSEGWRLLAMAWQPEIADETMTAGQVEAGFERMQELLGVPVEVLYCPHGAGPPACWCRKPLPGLGVVFVERHRLDPAQCIYVGAGPLDPGFARRLGFRYEDAASFFGRARDE